MKKEVVLKFKLPGFNRKEIKVKIKKNFLTINAEKVEHKTVKKKGFLHKEKAHKTFKYNTTLPNINTKKVKITFSKGLLIIKAEKI